MTYIASLDVHRRPSVSQGRTERTIETTLEGLARVPNRTFPTLQ